MSQRMINDNFWTDSWIEDRDPSEKLIYLYLLTNPLCNIAGIYEIKLKRIAYETGYDRDTVNNILNRFVEAGKIVRWNDWIYVVNFVKNQSSTNPSVLKGIQRILNSLPIELLTACIHPVHRMVHFTLLNLTLPNLTKLNSTEISDSDFSDTEIFHETSETSEGGIITGNENLEIQNVPPAEKLTISSTIKLVKELVESHGMVYASHPDEHKYSNAINRGKDFGENAERFGKDRIEFIKFILECSDRSKFWSKKLNNCREIYTHYAKVVNEVGKEIRNAEKQNLTVFC